MEKKSLVKCTMYSGIDVILRLFFLLFHFHQFYYNVNNTFDKAYLVSKYLVSEKVTNSGGLMLVCMWEGVSALAQDKFRSTIHLLSKHSLA